MTKRSIFGQAFVAGIVLFSGGAEGSQTVISREEREDRLRETVIPSEEIGGLSNQDLTQKRNEDSTEENERYRSSPRRYPVFYIDQSIWKTGQKSKANQDEGILSWILRRLEDIGFDDDTKGNEVRQDDNLVSQGSYKNYDKIEVEEHKEILITDDDGTHQYKMDDDVPAPTWTPRRTTLQPTIAPTPLDTTFWNDLDSLDTNMDMDGGDSKPTDTQITDTDLLLNRPDNSVVLRIVLGVVRYENMTEVDITNIINMAARALNVVLNKDEEIPFVVYDRLDYLNRDGEWNRDLGEAQIPSAPFRGEGKPRQRDADMADKYLAKLFLDNVVMEMLDNNWFEISSIYTVWRQGDFAPVKNRPRLTNIEGICSGSVERAMDQGIYWESLEGVRLGDPDLIIPGKNYYADDKGIVDAKDVGDEYDMADMFCPCNRPVHEEALECPKTDSDVTYSAVIADNMMEIEWGIREWVGFVLLCSTMLFVILLSLISDYVLEKRRMQQLWGAALTADGVDDFLQVGWQIYEKPPEEQPPEGVAPEKAQQQAQLYLHIYDKGRGEGYNDENSMLKGGVEPQLFAPSTDTDAPHAAPLQPHQNPQESKADEDAADPNKPS
eukprot:CAMPEP_0197191400 /NCGR_PEP_ID=MMETSP1423-20130617/23321_1 /TAXON_ID=476441 /ORGANISM="Pseudo-nitzschia heimii, Strain UNC1101" /LENGTH=607 /DNA_ID=CAMNT_0042644025 /DNA_START=251 /DNA_END=2074 /DNA_ORIENTATION=-